MNPTNAQNERDKLKDQVKFQRGVIYGVIGLSFGLVGVLGWMVVNQTVTIVPPEIRKQYEIGANYANRDYLSEMADYVLGQILTVSPDSVEHNNKVILRMTDPDGYGKLKSELEGAALRLKRDRVTTVWVPRKEAVLERDKIVRVSGQLKTYIADTLTSQRDKEYQVEFTITSSGRLYVLKVQEVVKPDPSAKPAGQQR